MEKEHVKPNVIYYTTNLSTLIEVVQKTELVKKSDLLQSEFIKLLGVYVTNKSGMVLVSFGLDGKLNGCMVISRHIDKKGEYIFIDFAWIDPHYSHLRNKYQEEVINECKTRGIKRIQARMNRGFKVMEKLYNAYEIGRIIEKEV